MITTHQARTVMAAREAKADALGALGSIDVALDKSRTCVLFQIPSTSAWEYKHAELRKGFNEFFATPEGKFEGPCVPHSS